MLVTGRVDTRSRRACRLLRSGPSPRFLLGGGFPGPADAAEQNGTIALADSVFGHRRHQRAAIKLLVFVAVINEKASAVRTNARTAKPAAPSRAADWPWPAAMLTGTARPTDPPICTVVFHERLQTYW